MGSSSSMIRMRSMVVKSEIRRSKAERRTEIRRPIATPPLQTEFGIRPSDFFRTSSFGFRIYLCRQFNCKPAPFAHCAAHAHLASMRLNDVLHNAEANPHPLSFAAQLRATPVKTLENLLMLFRRNAF